MTIKIADLTRDIRAATMDPKIAGSPLALLALEAAQHLDRLSDLELKWRDEAAGLMFRTMKAELVAARSHMSRSVTPAVVEPSPPASTPE